MKYIFTLLALYLSICTHGQRADTKTSPGSQSNQDSQNSSGHSDNNNGYSMSRKSYNGQLIAGGAITAAGLLTITGGSFYLYKAQQQVRKSTSGAKLSTAKKLSAGFIFAAGGLLTVAGLTALTFNGNHRADYNNHYDLHMGITESGGIGITIGTKQIVRQGESPIARQF